MSTVLPAAIDGASTVSTACRTEPSELVDFTSI
jgi:hypothetical protein